MLLKFPANSDFSLRSAIHGPLNYLQSWILSKLTNKVRACSKAYGCIVVQRLGGGLEAFSAGALLAFAPSG